MGFAFGIVLSPECHYQCTSCHETEANTGFSAQFLLEYKIRKCNTQQNAHFINGNDNADNSVLNGIVVAQPGCPCGYSRKEQKNKLFSVRVSQLKLLAFQEYNQPCHHQDHNRSYGGTQVGVHTGDAQFAENGCQCGKERRSKCIENVGASLYIFRLLLSLYHQDNPNTQQGGTKQLCCQVVRFAKAEDGQQHGQNRAGFVNGNHFVDIADGQCFEIADP